MGFKIGKKDIVDFEYTFQSVIMFFNLYLYYLIGVDFNEVLFEVFLSLIWRKILVSKMLKESKIHSWV